MSNRHTLNQESEFTKELSNLVETSQEIAVSEIGKVRSSALLTRTYMQGLIDMFVDVRVSKQREVTTLLEKKEHERVTKKPRVMVFISTHARFAGAIMPEVFEQFAKDVEKNISDVMVVGSVGRELFTAHFGSTYPCMYSDLSITHPQQELLRDLITTLLQYERLDVYQGQYQSLVYQKPVIVNMSGNTILREQSPQMNAIKNRRFLFEPSISDIVAFFETQITASLFRLSLDESSLANLGSHITALESSRHSLSEEIHKLELKKHLFMKRRAQKKQQQRLSGIHMW